MQKYSIEQIEERAKREKKPIEERMLIIPKLIEQKEQLVNELNQKDFDALYETMAEKKQEIEKIDHAILGKSEAIKPILNQRDMLFEIINSMTLKVNECRNAYLQAYNAVKNEIKSKISQVVTRNRVIEETNTQKSKAFGNICTTLNAHKSDLSQMQVRIEQLKEQRDDVKSRVFVDDKCAYCGQPANSADHIHPLVNGAAASGSITEIYNLLPCCATCNSSKGGEEDAESKLTFPKKGAKL